MFFRFWYCFLFWLGLDPPAFVNAKLPAGGWKKWNRKARRTRQLVPVRTGLIPRRGRSPQAPQVQAHGPEGQTQHHRLCVFCVLCGSFFMAPSIWPDGRAI
jgi:hypothetical protein